MSNAKNKEKVMQPTSAGSNLPAHEPVPELVGNINLETEIAGTDDNEAEQSDQQPQTKDIESDHSSLANLFTGFGMDVAQASQDGRPITELKQLALRLIPKDRQGALDYMKAIQRMQGIMEAIADEVRAAVSYRVT